MRKLKTIEQKKKIIHPEPLNELTKMATKIIALLGIAFMISSCEGPEGLPGLDGVNVLGKTLEFQTTFSAANNYASLYTFPSDVLVYESDAVLVYLLEETLSGSDGNTDVWTPLPQSFFVNQGLLQYTFNHTYTDVNILLQANFNLNNLNSVFTQNQVFRVVVMPAEFAQDPATPVLNLNALMAHLNIQESHIIKN